MAEIVRDEPVLDRAVLDRAVLAELDEDEPDEVRPSPTRWARAVTRVRERAGGSPWAQLAADPEAGMSTAEYAVGTVAACAFAAVLYQVVTGGSVVTALSGLVADALATLS